MATERPATLRLLALRAESPEAWRTTIRAALEARLSVPLAAAVLGIPPRTLQTWVRQTPALTDGLTLRGPGNPGKNGVAHTGPQKRK